jgi:Protein of unknown function DUF2620
MIKFVVCGMAKDQIARAVREAGGPEVDVKVTSDFEAAAAIKSGAADYYIGACQSGAGGALAVAIAMLGFDQVVRLSGVGSAGMDTSLAAQGVADGKRAFGIAHSHIEQGVPVLVRAIVAAHAAG